MFHTAEIHTAETNHANSRPEHILKTPKTATSIRQTNQWRHSIYEIDALINLNKTPHQICTPNTKEQSQTINPTTTQDCPVATQNRPHHNPPFLGTYAF
jgi:hypothetical protein